MIAAQRPRSRARGAPDDPELSALARFYATPEGESVMRKLLVLSDAVTPAMETALVAWARELGARRRAQSSADVSMPPKEDPR